MSTAPVLFEPCWPACIYSPGKTLLQRVPVYNPDLIAEQKFETVCGTRLPYRPAAKGQNSTISNVGCSNQASVLEAVELHAG